MKALQNSFSPAEQSAILLVKTPCHLLRFSLISFDLPHLEQIPYAQSLRLTERSQEDNCEHVERI
jgi:hypothetical protein